MPAEMTLLNPHRPRSPPSLTRMYTGHRLSQPNLVCLRPRDWCISVYMTGVYHLPAPLVNVVVKVVSNLTVGSSPDREMRLNIPIVIVPLRCTDNWITSHLGDEQDVSHPRPGSFGSFVFHGHRIDFCEVTSFTNFVIKAIYTIWNNNWIQLLFRIT